MPRMAKWLTPNPSRFCDLTPWNTWLWADYLSAGLYEIEGEYVLFRKMMDGTPTYFPITTDPTSPETMQMLIDLAHEMALPLCIFPLTEEQKDKWLACYPKAKAEISPDWQDYLYSADALATFRGKKFNGQRNHLNRFHALYPMGQCKLIDQSNKQEALQFLHAYYEEAPEHPALSAEKKQLLSMIENASFGRGEGLCGMTVSDGERVVALAVGEAVGDTLYIHAEKAFRDVHGAYQAIVSGFSGYFAERGILYVNREEDDGNEGLRISKLSYHPLKLLEKWRVTLT